MDNKMSLYTSVKSVKNKNISISDYVDYIKSGENQDLVLEARVALGKKDEEKYKELKGKSKCVTGSCTVVDGKNKTEANIDEMNDLIVLDLDVELDEQTINRIKSDKHTHILHKSFSGIHYCVFVKIKSDRFLDSFNCLADHYFSTHNILIDQSCKNKNRLRYLSYDPDIYVNEKSNIFLATGIKKFKPIPKPKTDYVFHQDDMDNILQQIQERNIDLCDEDYFRYVSIGMSLASEFGMSGEDKFHLICSFGGKYNEASTAKDYRGFVSNSKGQSTIGTFYYYCKEAGLELYSEKTKTIINRVKVAKSQGSPTQQSVVSALSVANNIEASESDKELIDKLIADKTDYSAIANEDVSAIEQIEKFIIDSYDPSYDELAHKIYINNRNALLTDTEINDIYIASSKVMDFNVKKDDVRTIIGSSSVPRFNILTNFIKENKGISTGGHIDEYIDCIVSGHEYNRWAFKRWMVGAMHNWTCSEGSLLVCPLTLVLTGKQHGTGKTSFVRHILPQQLRRYMVEGQINGADKDSMLRLCTNMIVLDDEFGGKGVKDQKAFKAISDTNNVTLRKPYGYGDMTYKRRAMLAGTSNEINVLKDVTGNRRLLPIQVNHKIDYDKLIALDTSKMLMESYNLLENGYDWIIRKQEDIDYIKENTSENEAIIPIEEIFLRHFSLEKTNEYLIEVVMNQGELLEYFNSHEISNLNPTKYDMDDVYTKNNMTYKAYRVDGKTKKGYMLYRKSINSAEDAPQGDNPF